MSIMLYKYPGKKFIHRMYVDNVKIEPGQLDEYLNKGWSRSPKEAKELYEQVISGELYPEETEESEAIVLHDPDTIEKSDIEELKKYSDVKDLSGEIQIQEESPGEIHTNPIPAEEKPAFGNLFEVEQKETKEEESQVEPEKDEPVIGEDEYLSAYVLPEDPKEETEPVEDKSSKKGKSKGKK